MQQDEYGASTSSVIKKGRRAKDQGFWAFIYTQLQGAFNDNVYKQVLVVLVGTLAVTRIADSPINAEQLTAAVTFIFTLPFLLFSMYGGELAEKFSKRNITIGVKIFEIFIMSLAILGFLFNNHYIWFFILFLFGTHSAFFGPTKYGILPDLVPYERLSWANGVLEVTTFFGIIVGTVAGNWIGGRGKEDVSFIVLPMVFMLGLSVSGLITAFRIPYLHPGNPSRKIKLNFFSDLWKYFKVARENDLLFLAIIGFMFFWCISSFAFVNIIAYTTDVLLLNREQNSYLMVSLIVGIASGSYLAGILSYGRIELGLVPIGGMIMTVFGLLLAIPGRGLDGAMFCIGLMGFGAGFFIVPIQALIQHLPDTKVKGGVQGLAYWLSNFGGAIACGVYSVLVAWNLSPNQIWVFAALLIFAMICLAVYKQPVILFRSILWIFGSTIYRLKVIGKENFPMNGGALLLSNHISFTDAFFIAMASPRQVRFIMHEHYYKKWYIRHFAKGMGIIPISADFGPKELFRVLKTARQAIIDGDIVCLFPEGQITRTGHIQKIRRGFERIVANLDTPIIPVYLGNVWGSVFSFSQHKFFFKCPTKIPYNVSVAFGHPMSSDSSPSDIRRTIVSLDVDIAFENRDTAQNLIVDFFKMAKQVPFKTAIVEHEGLSVNYLTLASLVKEFASQNKKQWKNSKFIAITLPQGIDSIVAFLGVLYAGRIPLVIDPKSPSFEKAVSQLAIQIVISQPLQNRKPSPAVMAEILLTPIKLLVAHLRKITQEHPATLLINRDHINNPEAPLAFLYSHGNISSAINAIGQAIDAQYKDRLIVLKRFDTCLCQIQSVFFPLLRGLTVITTPEDYSLSQIGQFCRLNKVTILGIYKYLFLDTLRSSSTGDFSSLRMLFCNGQALDKDAIIECIDKTGLRPLEIFGYDETCGLVSCSVPGVSDNDVFQPGTKYSSVGRLLPGFSIHSEPEFDSPNNVNKIFLKSPCVMSGYFSGGNFTETPLRHGWLELKDNGYVDEDGFLFIENH